MINQLVNDINTIFLSERFDCCFLLERVTPTDIIPFGINNENGVKHNL